MNMVLKKVSSLETDGYAEKRTKGFEIEVYLNNH